MFKIFHLLLLILTVNASGATTQDGRITILNNSKTDTASIIRLIQYADSVMRVDKGRGLQLLQLALTQSKAIGFDNGAFIVLNDLGVASINSGDAGKALSYFVQSAPYCYYSDAAHNAGRLYANTSFAYYTIGKYELTLQYLYKTLTLLKESERNRKGEDSSDIHLKLGATWARLGELSSALHHYKLAEEIAYRKNDTVMISSLFINIGTLFLRKNELDNAEAYYRKSLAIAYKRGSKYNEAVVLCNLGEIYILRKEYGKALEYFSRAASISRTSNFNLHTKEIIETGMGHTLLQMERYSEAEKILMPVLNSAYATEDRALLEMLLPHIIDINRRIGRTAETYKYEQQYIGIKDSLIKQEKVRSIDVLLNAKMAEKNKAMLAQQLFITQQKNQLQKKNFLVAGAVLSILIIASICFVILRIYRHKQMLQKAQLSELEQRQEIEELKALMRGEEQERTRIAQELHDGICSQLWAIRLNVESIDEMENDEVHRQKMASVFQQLNDTTQDVRKTAHNLMPDLLLEEGLATALASLCEKMRKNARLEVDFQEYGVVPAMDKEIELTIYCIVQELMQNVMKHAKQATNMLVQLSCAGTLLNITVEDNGSYFHETGDGVGLQQISKRTMALKGHFDLQHIINKGTTAYLEFDLQHLL